jgi:hypothetical protein
MLSSRIVTPLDLETFAVSRGFTEHELKELGVRIEGEEVVIPIAGRSGVWYERRHRPNGLPKYLSPAGVQSHLINPLGLGPHSDVVWFAEGEFDTFSLVVSGIPAVGILGAKTFHSSWRHLFDGAEIVIAFDPDAAGEEAFNTLKGVFPQAERFDVSPFEDLNDAFMADRSAFEKVVKAW